MLSLLVVLAVIITAANLINFHSMTRSADHILQVLAENDGRFPRDFGQKNINPGENDSAGTAGMNEAEAASNAAGGKDASGADTAEAEAASNAAGGKDASGADTAEAEAASNAAGDKGASGADTAGAESDEDAGGPGPEISVRGGFFGPDPGLDSPELPFESRYFSVLFDEDGNIESADVRNIAAIDEETAREYAAGIYDRAEGRGETEASGYQGTLRYLLTTGRDGTIRVIFLDCSQKLRGVRSTFLTSSVVALMGWLSVLGILIPVSGRMTGPIAESYNKQRRFITDAGHEIKTPITIINADADVLTMDIGENEWVTDIKTQAGRLTALTNDLIFLSRMDEEKPQIKRIDIPFSDLVEETADSFRQLAKSRNKHFEMKIQPLLTINGDPKSLKQLISILLDNAFKYSPDGGNISLSLKKEGRNVCLTVYNDSSYTITEETVKNMFDRFYRADASRNSEEGGYGIGLSIARAVVMQHKGRISGASGDGNDLTITVQFPAVEEREAD